MTLKSPLRTLTNDTVEIGMEVEVWSHPLVQPGPHKGATGRVVGILPPVMAGYSAAVAVQIPAYGDQEVVWFAPHHLIEKPLGEEREE